MVFYNIRKILERKLKHYRIRTYLFDFKFAIIQLKLTVSH